MDRIIMSTMPEIIPLSQAETQFDKRINHLIYAYNNAQHLGMKCMWKDKVLELSKKMTDETRDQIL